MSEQRVSVQLNAGNGPGVQALTSSDLEPECHEQFQQWLEAGSYTPASVRSSLAAARDDLSAASRLCELDALVPQVMAQLAARSDLSAHAKRRRIAQLATVQKFRLFLRGKRTERADPPPTPRRLTASAVVAAGFVPAFEDRQVGIWRPYCVKRANALDCAALKGSLSK